MMVAIRKTKAKEEISPDPVLDFPQGAHLKIMSAKLFAPKVHEETGDLWRSKLSLKLRVVDDHTEDGDADDWASPARGSSLLLVQRVRT